MQEAVPILQDLWGTDKLPVTIRKQIVRALVACRGPEVSLSFALLLNDILLHQHCRSC